MADYSRAASAERFAFAGMKVNASPDALSAGKHPLALNVRGYPDDTVSSRPQVQVVQSAPASGGGPVLALEPTLGLYKIGQGIFYAGALIDGGYAVGQGATLAPYRPNASPAAWEYIWDANQSRKALPGTAVWNTGIAEPQLPPEAAPQYPFSGLMGLAGATTGGTASGGSGGTRTTGTCTNIIPDPVFNPRLSVVVQGGSFAVGMYAILTDGTNLYYTIVEDLLPPLPSIQIQSIYYYAGATGRCVIVPSGVNVGSGIADSIYTGNPLATIRRGAVINIGGEDCFVLSSSVGPDGSLCFETSTTASHVPGEVIFSLTTLVVTNNQGIPYATLIGKPVTSTDLNFSVTAGVGWISFPLLGTPFSYTNPDTGQTTSAQQEDYLHFSVQCDDLSRLIEIKFMIDVSNGSADFTQNLYFYAVRPSDIQAGVANQLTQLGVAQLVAQRALIDEEQAAAANNQGATSSSAQTPAGSAQWAEILFPISALTRIGNDQTRSLEQAQAIRFLVNCTDTVSITLSSVYARYGGQVDVGDAGNPLFYCYRLRSSTTGAKSNRSPVMRYGVNPRRQRVLLRLPAMPGFDPQADLVDWFRMGGSLESFVYAGTQQLAQSPTNWYDDYADDAIEANQPLETDCYQPFPSVDNPFSAGNVTINGTTAVMSVASPGYLLRYLPGNEVQVGQQVYTLWTRPTLISGTSYLMQFVENAGSLTNATLTIFEPDVAAQPRPCVWGPDANGVFFGVGDPLRPGVVSHTNPQNPDGASDSYAYDLCPPSEPLQNGALLSGTSFAASANRWWQGYPQQDSARPYRWVECPVGQGLSATFGICSDGDHIYFIARDGIRMHSGGPSESLTDADLYTLFPHEGSNGQSYTYNGVTVSPPWYGLVQYFRLSCVNGYLYFDYQDITSAWWTAVCDLRRRAWSFDTFNDGNYPASTIHAGTSTPGGDNLTVNQQLYLGNVAGALYNEVQSHRVGFGEVVSATLATREEVAGDLRSRKLWGDVMLDCSIEGSALSATPMTLGQPFSPATAIATKLRTEIPPLVSLSGETLARSMGLFLTWTDQGTSTVLYSWQPSYLTQPEDITDRDADWDDAGSLGLKFFQGFLLEADTQNAIKSLVIRDSDTGQVHPFQGPDTTLNFNDIQHNGQQQKAYTFLQPFLAHLVRDEGANQTSWRRFGIKYVTQPTPELVLKWQTQATAHGIPGYQHVKQAMFAYNAQAPVGFTITVDGVEYGYTLPATNGYAKYLIQFQPVKGLVFSYRAVSLQPFQVWDRDFELFIGAWGRSGPYQSIKDFGATLGSAARI